MTLCLNAIRNCLEGTVPSAIATCAADGTPNVAYLSQVHFVDNQHVALSFQFFNKTRENILANPQAVVQAIDPDSAAQYQLTLHYQRTETAGALFEYMKAKLAGIASHSGMSKVFKLQGADVYRVARIETVPGVPLAVPPARRNTLAALRNTSQRLAVCADLAGLLDETLASLAALFDIHHTMLLMLDESGQRLYTVASRGYAISGVGSEIALGEGVIGVAARERTPIRIGHMAREYLYGRAVRASFLQNNPAMDLELEIPLPGLTDSRSQLAVPMLRGARLFGVLYVESPQDLRFNFEDEDALVTLAAQLAMSIQALEENAERSEEPRTQTPPSLDTSGTTVMVRRYTANDSIFINDDYLIKGVAGAIFWKLLRDYVQHGRTDFSNRELRLDRTLRLPDICDNLEAHLILLQRRMSEHCSFLGLEKTGRGRFHLRVDRPVQLNEV